MGSPPIEATGDERAHDRDDREQDEAEQPEHAELDDRHEVLVVEDVELVGDVGAAAAAEPRRVVDERLDVGVVVRAVVDRGVVSTAGPEEGGEGADEAVGGQEHARHRDRKGGQRPQV